MTVSWVGSFHRIETAGVSFILFLRRGAFFSGVTLAKLDHNPVKTETSKLSLGIVTSEGFGIFLIGSFH